MEKIGFISKENLILDTGINLIDKLLDVNISYDDRDLVEKRNDLLQPVCAAFMTTKNGKVFALNKYDKVAGERSPELGKTLLYIGGHLDESDETTFNIEIFKNGMKREILEELNYMLDEKNIYEPLVVYTPNTEKSSRHFGIIFKVMLEHELDLICTDGVCRFVDIDELKNIENIDSWSQLIIENIFKEK